MNSVHPIDRKHFAIEDPTPPGWRPAADSDEADGAGITDHTAESGATYRYRVTPFGSALSPYFFIDPTEHLMRYLRDKWGLDVLAYVDDVLCLGASRARVAATLSALRACMDYLGFAENMKKFEDIDERFSWLGLDVDTNPDVMEVQYPADKRAKLLELLRDFRQTHHRPGAWVSRAELATLIGRVGFASLGVRYGCLYLRRLYDALHGDLGHLTLRQRIHMRGRVQLSDEFWADFGWWEEALPLAQGVKFYTDRQTDFHRIYGDASAMGRGATWYADDGPRSFSHAWTPEMQVASSNLRELHTLWDCVQAFGTEWARGSRVCYATDNMTTAASVNRGSSASRQLDEMTRRIHLWGAAHDVEFISRWIPGTSIIREGSDGLSRADQFAAPDRTSWRLTDTVAAHWAAVHGEALELPLYMDVDERLREILRRRTADPAYTASICVPEWTSAAWWRLLRHFRPDHSYAAGARILEHPTRGTCATLHPMVILRLPAAGERPLSQAERRRAAAVTAGV